MDRCRGPVLKPSSRAPRRPRNTSGLVLTLGVGVDDWFLVDETVRVSVDALQKRKARVRIVAPREIPVLRRALFEALSRSEGSPTSLPTPPQVKAGAGPSSASGLVLTVGVGANDWFLIGDRVRVSVDSAHGRKARVRIHAPEEVRVFRKAVYEALPSR